MSGRINLDNMSEEFKSYLQGLDMQLENVENEKIFIKMCFIKHIFYFF